MTEQENVNAQGEINAHVANRLAKLETNNLMLERRYDEILRQFAMLEKQIGNLGDAYNRCASLEHYHDEYASVDHVERSENSFNSQISNLRNSLDNLEYRVNDAERKVERAQSTADSAARQARGGW